MQAISFFSGIGGLDAGFHAAGIDVRQQFEIDPVARAFLRKQFPGAELPGGGDVSALNFSGLARQAWVRRDELVLLCGAPCQPFSRARTWINGSVPGVTDSRGRLFESVLHALEKIRPAVMVFENVPGFASPENGALDALVDGIRSIGRYNRERYEVQSRVISADDFGVPQRRRRFVLIASRIGSFDFAGLARYQTRRSVWDALASVPSEDRGDLEITGKWKELVPSIPPGENYLWHTVRGGGKSLFGWRTRFWNFLLKLHPDQPSWTITAQPGSATGPFHWENRRLSLGELAALQSLPSSWCFSDLARNAGVRLIGNAVPSLLAQCVASEVAGQLFDCSVPPIEWLPITTRKPTVPLIEPVPRALLRTAVPKDHPGPGKGPLWASRTSRSADRSAGLAGATAAETN